MASIAREYAALARRTSKRQGRRELHGFRQIQPLGQRRAIQPQHQVDDQLHPRSGAAAADDKPSFGQRGK